MLEDVIRVLWEEEGHLLMSGSGQLELLAIGLPVYLEVLLPDAVVEDHLAHGGGECAGEGRDAPAAGDRLLGRKSGEEVVDRLVLVVGHVVRA